MPQRVAGPMRFGACPGAVELLDAALHRTSTCRRCEQHARSQGSATSLGKAVEDRTVRLDHFVDERLELRVRHSVVGARLGGRGLFHHLLDREPALARAGRKPRINIVIKRDLQSSHKDIIANWPGRSSLSSLVSRPGRPQSPLPAWQAQTSAGDDVALNLARAAADRTGRAMHVKACEL